MARQRPTRGLRHAAVLLIKVFFLVMLFYLVQVNVVPHLKLAGVMPNLLMLCIAILTVSLGKKYAFASGAVFGILLETMAPDMQLFNLVMYPALGLILAQAFADMSEIKRELRRIRIAQRQADTSTAKISRQYQRGRFHLRLRRNSANDLDPHLRILLNTLLLTAFYEAVMLIYIALSGVSLNFGHVRRMAYTILYTGFCCILMFPCRAFLGMYRRRPRRGDRQDGLGDEVLISEKDLRSISLEPDLPSVGAAPRVVAATKEDEPKPDLADADLLKDEPPADGPEKELAE